MTFQMVILWMTLGMTFKVKFKDQMPFSYIWPQYSETISLRGMIWSHITILLRMFFLMVTFWMTLRLAFKVKWPGHNPDINSWYGVHWDGWGALRVVVSFGWWRVFHMVKLWMTLNFTFKVKGHFDIGPCNAVTKSLCGMISSPFPLLPMAFQIIILWRTLSMTFKVHCRV